MGRTEGVWSGSGLPEFSPRGHTRLRLDSLDVWRCQMLFWTDCEAVQPFRKKPREREQPLLCHVVQTGFISWNTSCWVYEVWARCGMNNFGNIQFKFSLHKLEENLLFLLCSLTSAANPVRYTPHKLQRMNEECFILWQLCKTPQLCLTRDYAILATQLCIHRRL